MKFEAIIGLEIHIQPKTKSKMFCGCNADYFNSAPNTFVCPVCLGLPGALPVPNKRAIEQCLKLALALNCEINSETKFDRKHYFYPDLPKGYQISQYDLPIGFNGFLEINELKNPKRIHIKRIHMEEDTAKSIHTENETLIDFNKSGMPLIELVTEPDFRSREDVDKFAKRLRQIVRFLGVSDGDMEKGQMRYELNISLRPASSLLFSEGERNLNQKDKDAFELPKYKVEVKNIGSISLLQKIIDFEIKRQSEILERGQMPIQETRGAKDMTGETLSQRVKEDVQDYRYFPEPDIPPIEITDEFINSAKLEIVKLPGELIKEYKSKYSLSDDICETLASEKERSDYFNGFEIIENNTEVLAEIAKIICGKFMQIQQEDGVEITEIIKNKELLLLLVHKKLELSMNSTVFNIILDKIVDSSIIDSDGLNIELGSFLASSEDELKQEIEKTLASDPDAKSRYAKNPNVAMYFVGHVMRNTKGKFDPNEVKRLIEEKLR